jgi:hypothetical protein
MGVQRCGTSGHDVNFIFVGLVAMSQGPSIFLNLHAYAWTMVVLNELLILNLNFH